MHIFQMFLIRLPLHYFSFKNGVPKSGFTNSSPQSMQFCFWVKLSVRFARLIPNAHSQSRFGSGHSSPPPIPDPHSGAVSPSQALVLDAARQHHNTWVSDSWNAFGNPLAVHWVHFYSQCYFTVLNSQISSGSHSLSMIFVTSLVCLSSACWDEDGKGTDAPGAVASLTRPQLFSVQVVRPWLHEQKTWICVVPNLFSAHLSWIGNVCWAGQSSWCSLCHHNGFVLTPHLPWDSTYSWDGSEAQGLIWHKAWLFRANPAAFLK